MGMPVPPGSHDWADAGMAAPTSKVMSARRRSMGLVPGAGVVEDEGVCTSADGDGKAGFVIGGEIVAT